MSNQPPPLPGQPEQPYGGSQPYGQPSPPGYGQQPQGPGQSGYEPNYGAPAPGSYGSPTPGPGPQNPYAAPPGQPGPSGGQPGPYSTGPQQSFGQSPYSAPPPGPGGPYGGPPPAKSKLPLFIALGVVAALVIGAIVFFVTRDKDTDQDTTEGTTTSQPSTTQPTTGGQTTGQTTEPTTAAPPPASGDGSSFDQPLAAGSEFVIQEDGADAWRIQVTNVDWNASIPNAEPSATGTYGLVEITIERLAAEPGTPYAEIFWTLYGTDQSIYNESMEVAPNDLFLLNEMATGETGTGDLLFEVPSGVSGGVIEFSTMLGESVFVIV